MDNSTIVGIWDDSRSIICLRCATDEEQANVKSWDIIREEGVKELKLGNNALICPRCARVMYPAKKA